MKGSIGHFWPKVSLSLFARSPESDTRAQVRGMSTDGSEAPIDRM